MSNDELIIHVAWSPGEARIAVTRDGVLIDLGIWRRGSPDGVGDIYRGRVTAIVPTMGGAFVALPGMRPGKVVEGFLPDSEGAKGATVGASLTVRVSRAATGGKGPRLSAGPNGETDAAPEAALGLVQRGIDPLREIAARYPEAAIQIDDAALAASLHGEFGQRLVRVRSAFGDAIEAELESLSGTEVTLASGARLSLHPTPALVAIDVDAAEALGTRGDATRHHLVLNATLAAEIARQIRLRNLSGAIFVDFAGLRAKQRARLSGILTDALATDPLRPRLLGFTALGLAEIARPRIRPPLHEMLSGPHAAGLRALRAMAVALRSEPGQALVLRAAPAVLAALDADTVALADFRRIAGRPLVSRSAPSLPPTDWTIEAYGAEN